MNRAKPAPSFSGRPLLALFALLMSASAASAASPQLRLILPRGAQRGTELDLTFNGARLTDAKEIIFYAPGIVVTRFETAADKVKVHVKIAADAPLGEYQARVRTTSGISELQTFWVGPYPTVPATQPAPIHFETPQKIALNVTVSGVIEQEQVHYFQVDAKKGQRLSVEVEGIRLADAMFDPYVAIYNSKHFALITCDDTPLLKQDPFASIVVPADGTYIVAVRDSSFGGAGNFHYRMHVGTFPRPHVLYPCGGKAGENVQAQFIGDVTGPIAQTLQLPADADGERTFYAQKDGQSPPSPNAFRVCPFPNVMEAEPNHKMEEATKATVEPPLAFNGIIAQPGETDFFKFTAKKDHPLDITVFARRLGSPLDSFIDVFTAKGQYIAGNDDSGGPDSYYRFNPPADGEYVVAIRDQLRSGGPDYVYRIEVTPPRQSVVLAIPPANNVGQASQERQTIVIPRGNRFATLVRLTRLNVGGDMNLAALDLPPGVTMRCDPIDGNQQMVPVIFEAAPDAGIGGKLCDLIAKPADEKLGYVARFEQKVDLVIGNNNTSYKSSKVQKIAVAVANEVPFTVKIIEPKVPIVHGGALNLKVVIERKPGFDKPVSIRLLYKQQGIGTAGQVDIPAGKSEAILPLSCTPEAKPGKHRIVALASADIDGPAYVASPLANLEVAQPFIALKVHMSAVEQGQTGQVACEIEPHTPFEGSAKFELLGLPPNTTTEPEEVTAAEKQVIFYLVADPKAQPGQNNSLFCRVTIMKDGEPIVHNLGQGGVLRIDPKSQPKKAAPQVAIVAKPAKPTTAPVKVLSRLEKLRLEQAEAKD